MPNWKHKVIFFAPDADEREIEAKLSHFGASGYAVISFLEHFDEKHGFVAIMRKVSRNEPGQS
jgi:hypothetical protein